MKRRKLLKKQINDFREVAKDVFVLSFTKDFDFIPGQVVAIHVEEEGKPRLYSIASGTQDDNIEILFDEKKNGELTPFLSRLNIGDYIWVSAPFGRFHCDDEEAWWIASGTGVAPYVSMLRSGMTADKKLIHGGRYDENFYFQDVVEDILGENYIRCNSKQEDTKYFKGRLTRWLTEQPVLPEGINYYLCGSAEMVVDVRDLLISRGVPFRNIISETYF